MLTTIKDYWEEFSLLPKFVKYAIAVSLMILLLVAGFNIIRNYRADQKINELEKMNQQLTKAAVTAQSRAKKAEEDAADEGLRAMNLETQLKNLQTVKTSQDNAIQKQSNKVNTIHNSITHLRVSQPRPITTDELERRLDARYGQENSH